MASIYMPSNYGNKEEIGATQKTPWASATIGGTSSGSTGSTPWESVSVGQGSSGSTADDYRKQQYNADTKWKDVFSGYDEAAAGLVDFVNGDGYYDEETRATYDTSKYLEEMDNHLANMWQDSDEYRYMKQYRDWFASVGEAVDSKKLFYSSFKDEQDYRLYADPDSVLSELQQEVDYAEQNKAYYDELLAGASAENRGYMGADRLPSGAKRESEAANEAYEAAKAAYDAAVKTATDYKYYSDYAGAENWDELEAQLKQRAEETGDADDAARYAWVQQINEAQRKQEEYANFDFAANDAEIARLEEEKAVAEGKLAEESNTAKFYFGGGPNAEVRAAYGIGGSTVIPAKGGTVEEREAEALGQLNAAKDKVYELAAEIERRKQTAAAAQSYQTYTDLMSPASTDGNYAELVQKGEELRQKVKMDVTVPGDGWSQNELDTYNYYIATDREKADSMARYLNGVYEDEERRQAHEATAEAWGSSVLGHIVGVPLAAVGGLAFGLLSYADRLLSDDLQGGAITRGAEWFNAISEGIREHGNELSGTINVDTGSAQLDYALELFNGKGLGDAEMVLQSVVQSYAAIGAGKLIAAGGKALGAIKTAEAAQSAITATTDVLFFGSAASEGIQTALDRGLSPTQAVVLGTFNGIAEALGEHWSIENLIEPNFSQGVLASIAEQGFIEGTEEVFTTFMNTVADNLVSGGKTEYNQEVLRLINEEGMSAEDARKQATKATLGSIAFDFVSGFASGAISMGGQAAVNKAAAVIERNVAERQEGAKWISIGMQQALFDVASQSDKDSAAYKLWSAMDSGNITTNAKNVGRLCTELAAAYKDDLLPTAAAAALKKYIEQARAKAAAQNSEASDIILANGLAAVSSKSAQYLAEHSNLSETARTQQSALIDKLATGIQLTDAELKTLKLGNTAVQKALEELGAPTPVTQTTEGLRKWANDWAASVQALAEQQAAVAREQEEKQKQAAEAAAGLKEQQDQQAADSVERNKQNAEAAKATRVVLPVSGKNTVALSTVKEVEAYFKSKYDAKTSADRTRHFLNEVIPNVIRSGRIQLTDTREKAAEYAGVAAKVLDELGYTVNLEKGTLLRGTWAFPVEKAAEETAEKKPVIPAKEAQAEKKPAAQAEENKEATEHDGSNKDGAGDAEESRADAESAGEPESQAGERDAKRTRQEQLQTALAERKRVTLGDAVAKELSDYTEADKAAVAFLVEKGFDADSIFITDGRIGAQERDGQLVGGNNGFINTENGKPVIVLNSNAARGVLSIAKHEYVHYLVFKRGGLKTKDYSRTMSSFVNRVGLDTIVEMLTNGYAKQYLADAETWFKESKIEPFIRAEFKGETDEQISTRMAAAVQYYMVEEILGDAYAGMDNYGQTASDFDAIAQQLVEEMEKGEVQYAEDEVDQALVEAVQANQNAVSKANFVDGVAIVDGYHFSIIEDGDLVRWEVKDLETGKTVRGPAYTVEQAKEKMAKAMAGIHRESKELLDTEPTLDPIDPAFSTRESKVSLGEAFGFGVDRVNGDKNWRRADGSIVTEVTKEDIARSPVGALLRGTVDIALSKDAKIADPRVLDQYAEAIPEWNSLSLDDKVKAVEAILDQQMEMLAAIGTAAVGMNDFADSMQLMGSAIFTAMKANADKQYGTTYDFPSICTKTQAVINNMSSEMVRLQRGLTKEEIERIYAAEFYSGNPVPCPECYVFSRWVGIGGLLENMFKYQNTYAAMTLKEVQAAYDKMEKQVENHLKDLKAQEAAMVGKKENGKKLTLGQAKIKLRAELDKEFSALDEKISKQRNQGEQPSQKDLDRYAELSKSIVDIRALTWLDTVYFLDEKHTKARPADPKAFDSFVMSPEVLFDLNRGEDFARQYPAAWGYRTSQGAGYGKAITPYAEAVLGEGIHVTTGTAGTIAKKRSGTFKNAFLTVSVDKNGVAHLSKDAMKKLTAARKKQLTQGFYGGQRLQSTSDARFENATDYLIAAIEMQAMGARAQVYTKVAGAVDTFEILGMCTNQSLMPSGGGVVNGEIKDTPVGGMHPEVAKQNRDRDEHAGTITIGVNDEHIRAMFGQVFRDFIIPYHASGGNAELISQMRKVQDPRAKSVHSTDYSRTQGEKELSDAMLTALGKSEAEIDLIHRTREARLQLLKGELNKVDMTVVKNNPVLERLYSRVSEGGTWYGISCTKDVVEHQIFPNEYWDYNSTWETSGVNTQTYLDYCESLGFLHKFSGTAPQGGANPSLRQLKGYNAEGKETMLTDLAYKEDGGIEPYFWQTLVDHRMYGADGKYLPQPLVSLAKLAWRDVDQSEFNLTPITEFAKPDRFGEKAGRQYNEPISQRVSAELAAGKTIEEFRQAYIDKYGVDDYSRESKAEEEYGVTEETLQTDDMAIGEANETRYSKVVDDPKLMAMIQRQVDAGEVTKTYKAYLLIDGKLYSPMASMEKDERGRYTKLRGGNQLFDWVQSEGKLSQADYDEAVRKYGKFSGKPWLKQYAEHLTDGRNPWGHYIKMELKKPKDDPTSDLKVAYNPYQHSSDFVLNDQFDAAYRRPQIVVVECIIPNSELTDFYWAPYAKDPIGKHSWKSGPIALQMKNTRSVYMTRYIQPQRILSDREVAEKIMEYMAREPYPPLLYWNNFTPGVLQELLALGADIEPYGSPGYLSRSGQEAYYDMYGNPISDDKLEQLKEERAARKTEREKVHKAAEKAEKKAKGSTRYSREDLQYADPFYSYMQRIVETKMPAKMGADQVEKFLLGKGVKAEEIKWSGLSLFTEGKKSVNKDELLQFLKENEVKVEETTLGRGPARADFQKKRGALAKKIQDMMGVQVGNAAIWDLNAAADRVSAEINNRLTDSPARAARKQFERRLDESFLGDAGWYGFGKAAVIRMMELSALRGNLIEQMESWSPGLTTSDKAELSEWERLYFADREENPDRAYIAEKLRPLSEEMEQLKLAYLDSIREQRGRTGYEPQWRDYATNGYQNYREYLYAFPGGSYVSPASQAHWGGAARGAEGIFAHARVDDMTVGEGGGKVLFVEEIQSDWNNAYNKQDTTESVGFADVLILKRTLAEELVDSGHGAEHIREEDENGFSALPRDKKVDLVQQNISLYGGLVASEITGEVLAEARAGAYISELTGETLLQVGAPDAPYAGKTGSYLQYVLKNMLRKAAEDGYAYLAWTPGRMQEERWSSDYAEGYRIEYDQDIPKFLKKYGKQWGATVSTITLDNNGQEVWAMEITDPMRDAVLYEGQTRFSNAEEFLGEKPTQEYMAVVNSIMDGEYSKVVGASEYSGGGLVDYGLASFIIHRFAVEFNPKLSPVFIDNFGRQVEMHENVLTYDAAQYRGQISHFHSSPPCCNLSSLRHSADRHEDANDIALAKKTAEHIAQILPMTYSLENVAGYRDTQSYNIIKATLLANGYSIKEAVYSADDYGDATKRRRLILLASRDGRLPGDPVKVTKKVTWGEVVSDLIDRQEVASFEEINPRMVENLLKIDGLDVKSWEVVTKDKNGHETRTPMPNQPLLVLGNSVANKSYPHAYANEVAMTLPAESGASRIFMPDGRVLKVDPRILARITGLGDDYKLPASKDTARRIIGNGIPVNLTKAVIGPLIQMHSPGYQANTDSGAQMNMFGEMGNGGAISGIPAKVNIESVKSTKKVKSKKMAQRTMFNSIDPEIEQEYLQAAESGDMETAEKLFNQTVLSKAESDITPFLAAGKYRAKGHPAVAKALKNGDQAAIETAAAAMAELVPEGSVLVPIPSHTGVATDTLVLAKAIAEKCGAPVLDVLKGDERQSHFKAKQQGKAMSVADMRMRLDGDVPSDKRVIFIDNVVATGTTGAAAVRAVGRGVVLGYAYAGNSKNILGLKSAEPVTYDDDGNVIPLSERLRVDRTGEDAWKNSDIRYAKVDNEGRVENPYAKGTLEYELLNRVTGSTPEDVELWLQSLLDKANGITREDITRMSAASEPLSTRKGFAIPPRYTQADRDAMTRLLEELRGNYGALKEGENAAREANFPQRVNDETYVRRFWRTATEAKVTPEHMVDELKHTLLSGDDAANYVRISDAEAVRAADQKLADLGWDKSLTEWEQIASPLHRPTKYDVAFGETLYVAAARQGMAQEAERILADLAEMSTTAGQVVQGFSMLKKMGVGGQLHYVERVVDRMNAENEKKILTGKAKRLVITEADRQAILNAETREEMDKLMEALIQRLADDIPVTMMEKWNAWRYLSMLGNARTHGRNIIGNFVFMPVVFLKNALAAAGEAVFVDKAHRTKYVGPISDDVKAYAKEQSVSLKNTLQGGGKYNVASELMDRRHIFKNKFLEGARKFNGAALETEDWWALKPHFERAFAGFIMARGVSVESLRNGQNAKLLHEAQQYAIQEAQKATYRDASALASAISQLKRTQGLGLLIEGVLPFAKTPVNILRRAVDYSPVGIIKGLSKTFEEIKAGKKSAAEGITDYATDLAAGIDMLSSGAIGTIVMMLGFMLAKMGVAKGKGDDDDDDALKGIQDYSLTIGGVNFTIDWVAPMSMPFFVGVALDKLRRQDEEGDLSAWDVMDSLTTLAEPMLSLSMLDGLNSALSSTQYADGNQKLTALLINMISSYAAQGVPTVMGQLARTIDDTRRATYIDKNVETPSWMQSFIQRSVQGKVPWWESHKMAYVDAWGRTDTQESLVLRALENFLSPAYVNMVQTTPMDTELERLVDATGDASLYVSKPTKQIGKVNLTASQYEELCKSTGTLKASMLAELFTDMRYAALNDDEKAVAVNVIYEYVGASCKKQLMPDYKLTTKWILNAMDSSDPYDAVWDRIEARVEELIKKQNESK